MEKVFLGLTIASVALALFILAKRGVFTGIGSGTGSTPSGKKFKSAPLVGFLGRFAAYVVFVLFLGFLGSNYPDSSLGTIWVAWNKFFWFFWGSHILMVAGIARYQYDLHSTRLIWLWIVFVPFGVLFIALEGKMENAKKLFSTSTGGEKPEKEIQNKYETPAYSVNLADFANTGFRIVADREIRYTIPGHPGKTFLYRPGDENRSDVWSPAARIKNLADYNFSFWDPSDPVNGKVEFLILKQ